MVDWVRSGRHAHVPGSSSASCGCNVQRERWVKSTHAHESDTRKYGSLSSVFLPIRRRIKKECNQKWMILFGLGLGLVLFVSVGGTRYPVFRSSLDQGGTHLMAKNGENGARFARNRPKVRTAPIFARDRPNVRTAPILHEIGQKCERRPQAATANLETR